MSKYKSKQQLLDEIVKEKAILEVALNSVDKTKLGVTGACGEWSIKDIICHLTEWQEMVLSWYEIGLTGETPEVPGKGYKWSQLPELNNEIYKKYKDISWEEAQQLFHKSEERIMLLVNTIDEEKMLKPALQPWMNNNTLIAYFGSCTSSHYKWASGFIKKFIKK